MLPGTKNFMNWLRNSGKCVKIITNNTVFGRKLLSSLFIKQGVDCQPDDFITPTCAIINYLKQINFKGKLWVMGFESMIQELKSGGIEIAETEKPRIVQLQGTKDYLLNLDPEIKGIVVDLDINSSFGCLAKAVKYLNSDPDILLIYGSTDDTIPIGSTDLIIGPTYFQRIVAEATHRQAIKLGKPHDGFGRYLSEALNCDPARTLFIGDSLDHDIGFAKRLGFKQILVLTGNTTIHELQGCHDGVKPDYYINSIEELHLLLTK